MAKTPKTEPVAPVQRPKPGTPEWTARAAALARSFCPPIRPCRICTQPVVEGYVCTFCSCDEPEPQQRCTPAAQRDAQ